MNLVNMKMDQEEMDEYGSSTMVSDAPEYPYGLKLDLDSEALKKLGINQLPAVGQKYSLMANVEVCCTSQYESQDAGMKSSMSLQITDMALGNSSAVSVGTKIYGNS